MLVFSTKRFDVKHILNALIEHVIEQKKEYLLRDNNTVLLIYNNDAGDPVYSSIQDVIKECQLQYTTTTKEVSI